MTASGVRGPIPLIIVGGYLGAGKTTLLNHVLANAGQRRITVLVNDFGAINIDAALIRERTDDVITLENGCVCCSIGGRLVDALLAISNRPDPPDFLIIEASGVSDPVRIAQIGLLDRAYRLYGIIVAVDLASITQTLLDPYVGDIARQQIAGATAILLTKTDLIDEHKKAAVVAELTTVAHTGIMLETTNGAVPLELFFDENITGQLRTSWPRPMTGLNPKLPVDFCSFLFSTTAHLDRKKLKGALRSVSGHLLRAKGLIRLDGEAATQELHVAGGRILITPFPGEVITESVIVLIGIFDNATEQATLDALAAAISTEW
ncbi:P-loop guanosine triphosphatase YjiA [Caballeronia sp. SBC1]|uniref:CobW family GTP-binding protein n=1 Tax=unclassified Caballeronia TaxID=2646786 RepID=UPI0013E132F3|nr:MULTISPECIES: CobW family GTP-binding protein [unclassified Caballeronia]QIE23682.1 P-loop guanosine triphosphatase YjiA [Caballeronia sp. SBC2]QIN61574.1 P-loop guanosine triphosphatase YjiA [Caballeronia sp. SBC1]